MSKLRDKHLPNFKDIDCKGKTQLTAFENCLMRIINKLAGEGVVMCDDYEEKIEQLCTERDEARQDAARYRWLKSGGLYRLPSTEHGMGEEFDFREWDQLIDAHMKEETP